MSDEPSNDELLRHASAKPTGKKPLSVWIAQILCAFGSAGAIYFALLATDLASKVSMGLLALLYVGLLYGTEKRQTWSRWFLAVFLALGAVSTLLQARQDPSGGLSQIEIKPEERRGVAAGQAATIVLIMLLAGRLAFGAPAKRYFSRTPNPKDQ